MRSTEALLILGACYGANGLAMGGATPTMGAPSTPAPLLIVGAGVLGRLAAHEWRREATVAGGSAEDCVVVGVTRKADSEREAALVADGITPRLRDDVDASGERWPYVLFCASPSGNDDYVGAVTSALDLWDDADGVGGRFVFTSSAGVFSEDAGGVVTEDSPVADTARAAKLLEAESKVRARGGTVLRLAGLYLEARGAHNYWLTTDKDIAQRPDGLINQVHYRDAAAAAVAALLRGPKGEVLLAADDKPLSREEIAREAQRAPRFSACSSPRFTGSTGGLGKVVDCSRTRAAIGWEPRYKTFSHFIDEIVSEASK